MNCIQCGAKNERDAEYCENCGNPLRQVCAHCGSPLKPGVKFCNKCGNPVSNLPLSKEVEKHLAALREAAPPELQDKIRSASSKIEGERKPVTILFTDIVGSTAIAEKLDPEEWEEIVSYAHRRVSQAVYCYEGTIAQLLGDGVLAFFGAPVTHEDDPVRAVRAALDIQNDIAEYARTLKGYLDNFQMRIGINTGLVVVTSVGSDLHMEYLAIGDAVNLAARLQSAAQPGKILLSENTARLVKAAFDLQSLGEITVKGRAQKVHIYEVVERKEKTESLRGFEELVSPLVGRENELASLRVALDALLAAHGQIVSVIGEAGIGKSRLVEEARKLVMIDVVGEKSRPHYNLHWIEGRALSYGQTLSFWTVTQMIKDDLGLSDGDPEPKMRAVLRRRLKELFGERVGDVLPYLANLLGVKMEVELSERIRILDGETLKRQTLSSITRYFEQIAKEQPTVLVLEDLHWTDPSSLEALKQLFPLTDRVPLLLLLLYRPERDLPSWGIKIHLETDYAHRYTEIILQPLTHDEQNQLVDNLLAVPDLPEARRGLILARAEGNPFYLEEIVRNLIEQGGFVREGGQWRTASELVHMTIPDTLQGVLLARIDRLQEDVRRTLQLASVIGKSFLYRLLEAIAEAEQELDRHLSQLQRVDLVREKSRIPELEHMFKHSLTQEATYNSLLIERRKEFHRRVGEALETLFPERKEEFLGLLAHHFDAAGEWEKAIAYLVQAGDRARLTDEHTEAIVFYQRACQILSELGDEIEADRVWLKLGMVYHTNFQFEAAHQAYKKAFLLQQKSKPLGQPNISSPLKVLRVCSLFPHVSLDPGRGNWIQDFRVQANLFSPLVEIDGELNVVPNVAHSWEVLEGGKRYLFHLRDDVFWTDGSPVTALDFEWAWKRNLTPEFESDTAPYLFDVVGARDYHEGRTPDPSRVGVHALDNQILEVSLVEPVACFPYKLSLPVTYPLPKSVIQRYGDSWWEAGKMVSNGAFKLVEFDAQSGGAMEHNPDFHGDFPGNLHRVEWTIPQDLSEKLRMYRENRTDLVYLHGYEPITEFPPLEKIDVKMISMMCLQFGVHSPPLNDLRVRKALILALDKQKLSSQYGFDSSMGGLIPPNMPGHSPDIGQDFNIESARQLLAEAGYPGGHGFPVLTGWYPYSDLKITAEITRQWQENLGIETAFEEINPLQLGNLRNQGVKYSFMIMGWVADYPDPDCILGQVDMLDWLHYGGWQDDEYDRLVENAARASDREKRMAMYRQADRFLTNEKVLISPLSYTIGNNFALCKPWVKNYQTHPCGRELLQNVIMEDH